MVGCWLSFQLPRKLRKCCSARSGREEFWNKFILATKPSEYCCVGTTHRHSKLIVVPFIIISSSSNSRAEAAAAPSSAVAAPPPPSAAAVRRMARLRDYFAVFTS